MKKPEKKKNKCSKFEENDVMFDVCCRRKDIHEYLIFLLSHQFLKTASYSI